jgi:hypothetical protein
MFALCPDGGLPRLWRFVEDDDMTEARIVSKLDPNMNVLLINRTLFDQLGELNRIMVLRTHALIEYV